MKDSRSDEISVWQCVKEGWRTVNWPMIAFVVLFLLVSFGLGFAMRAVLASELAQRIVGKVIGILLFQPLMFGFQFYCLQRYRNRQVDMKVVFHGFGKYKSVIMLALLFSLLFVVASLLNMYVESAYKLPQDRQAPSYVQALAIHIAAMLVGMGIVSYIAMFFFPAPFLILDRGFGVAKALKVSWAMTGRRKAMIARLLFAGCLLFLAGIIMFLVGVIVAMAVSVVASAAMYQKLCELHPDIVK